MAFNNPAPGPRFAEPHLFVYDALLSGLSAAVLACPAGFFLTLLFSIARGFSGPYIGFHLGEYLGTVGIAFLPALFLAGLRSRRATTLSSMYTRGLAWAIVSNVFVLIVLEILKAFASVVG